MRRVDVLGPLRVVDDSGEPTEVRGVMPRRMLALLVAGGGSGASTDTLLDELWFGEPPATARTSLRNTASRVRSRTGLDIEHTGSHYRLSGPVAVDAWDLDAAIARRTYHEAIGLWRGEPYEGFEDLPWLTSERRRLVDAYLDALEHTAVAGDDDALLRRAVGELTDHLAADPVRESLATSLAVGLYRLGRQVEALRVLRSTADTIREATGLEPTERLVRTEDAILQHRIDGLRPPSHGIVTARDVDPAPSPPSIDPLLHDVGHGRFVGRRGELDTLLLELKRSPGRSQPPLLVVCGPSGMGKTWLLAELARRANSEGMNVAYGRTDPAGALPLLCWAELTRSLAAGLPGDMLRRAVGDLDTSIDRLCPGLLGGERRTAAPGDAISERNRLSEACARVVRAGAAVNPCVLVIDDLQWLTSEDLVVLRHVLGDTTTGVAVVGALRTDDPGAASALHSLRDDLAAPRGTVLDLGGLTEPDISDLVARFDLPVRELRPSELTRLAARTNGSPLALEQILRHLPEVDVLPYVDELLGAAADTPAGSAVTGAQSLLARLPEPTLAVLETAAVAGVDVDVAHLSLLTGASDDTIADDLQPALRAGLLWTRPTDEIAFRHIIYRDVLYERQSPVRRQRLHARLAVEVAGMAPPTRCYHALAGSEHLDDDVVLEAVWEAVEWLIERGSFSSAFDLIGRVIDRDVPLSIDHGAVLDLRRIQARCLLLMGRTDEARERYRSVTHTAASAGLVRAQALVAIEYDDYGRTMSALSPRFEMLTDALRLPDLSPELRVEVAAERINEGFYYGRTLGRRETVALQEQSVDVLADAERLGRDRPLVAALNARHMALLAEPPAPSGDLHDDRLSLSAAMLDAAERLGDPVYLGIAHQNRMHDLLQVARTDDADDLLAGYWELVTRCHLPRVRWMGHMMSSALGRLRDDVEGADAELDEMVALGTRHGYVDTEPCRLAHRIAGALAAGDAAHLAAEIEPVMTGFYLPEWRLIHAIAMADGGGRASADRMADEFEDGYEEWPRNVFWQTSLAFAAELLTRVEGHAALSARVAADLAGYAGGNIVVGAVVCVLGPADHFISRLARRSG